MMPLPEDRVAAFEAWLRRCWWAPNWYRRRGALACSFGLLGLRWAEVEVMRPVDLGFSDGELFVRTRKRGRPRRIDAPPELLRAADDLRSFVAGGEDRVFVTKAGRGMVYQDVRRAVASCTRAVFGRPYSFHCFRHTAAVRAYRRTGDVLAVQRFLGHKSLQWTNVYLQTLMVVDVGGPVAFAGGGDVARPRLYDPVGVVAAKGKAAAAGDQAAFEVDRGAGLGHVSEVRPVSSPLDLFDDHSCGKELVLLRGKRGFMVGVCRVCSAAWEWPKGKFKDRVVVTPGLSVEERAMGEGRAAARRRREVKAGRSSEPVQASSRVPCAHVNREERPCEGGGVGEWCMDCGAFYGRVRPSR